MRLLQKPFQDSRGRWPENESRLRLKCFDPADPKALHLESSGGSCPLPALEEYHSWSLSDSHGPSRLWLFSLPTARRAQFLSPLAPHPKASSPRSSGRSHACCGEARKLDARGWQLKAHDPRCPTALRPHRPAALPTESCRSQVYPGASRNPGNWKQRNWPGCEDGHLEQREMQKKQVCTG